LLASASRARERRRLDAVPRLSDGDVRDEVVPVWDHLEDRSPGGCLRHAEDGRRGRVHDVETPVRCDEEDAVVDVRERQSCAGARLSVGARVEQLTLVAPAVGGVEDRGSHDSWRV
jgi:hypothetical protein